MCSHLSFLSFLESRKIAIVVDIQGVELIFTDPVIHSIDKTRYGNTNLGIPGIIGFFNSHNKENYDCCKLFGKIDPLTICSLVKLLYPNVDDSIL